MENSPKIKTITSWKVKQKYNQKTYTKKAISFPNDDDLLERIEKYCSENDMHFSSFMRKAAIVFLDTQYKQSIH